MNNVDLAVMDIGSNGVRILWREGNSLENRRVALRLGEDAFGRGEISKHTYQKLKKTCQSFARFVAERKIGRYRVIGTAALREANNGSQVVQSIFDKTGVDIEIIDAREEARLLCLGISSEIPLEGKLCLLLDLGGGSGEYVVTDNQEQLAFFTAPVGGVRILEEFRKLRMKCTVHEMGRWIEDKLSDLYVWQNYFDASPRPKFFIATGGNPRALGKLARALNLERSSSEISKESVQEIISRLAKFSLSDRRIKFGLNRDRADVIFPSALVLWFTMEIMNIKSVHVPPVGLKNGLLEDVLAQKPQSQNWTGLS